MNCLYSSCTRTHHIFFPIIKKNHVIQINIGSSRNRIKCISLRLAQSHCLREAQKPFAGVSNTQTMQFLHARVSRTRRPC